MPLDYRNLDERTRAFMVEEIDIDIAAGKLYLSPWLTERGQRDWPDMLRDAARGGSDATLAGEIMQNGRLREKALRRKPKGEGMVEYRIPDTAPDTMAEGEFNRFYVRALCRRVIDDGIPHLVVYRAKQVMNPRPESQAKIGAQIDPAAILADLRETPGLEPALGLPPGPNSGLSAHLP